MIFPRESSSEIVTKVPPALSPWRISSERYLEMIREGVLGPDDRVELINGMIIEMSPAGSKHDYVTNRLIKVFTPICNDLDFWVQSTLVVDSSHIYDPDFLLLKPRPSEDSYKDRHPDAHDVALVIEVAGSSLAKDREIKRPVYAAAGIPEFWLIDLESETIFIHRDPTGDCFQFIREVQKSESVDARCLPGKAISVSSLFE